MYSPTELIDLIKRFEQTKYKIDILDIDNLRVKGDTIKVDVRFMRDGIYYTSRNNEYQITPIKEWLAKNAV